MQWDGSNYGSLRSLAPRNALQWQCSSATLSRSGYPFTDAPPPSWWCYWSILHPKLKYDISRCCWFGNEVVGFFCVLTFLSSKHIMPRATNQMIILQQCKQSTKTDKQLRITLTAVPVKWLGDFTDYLSQREVGACNLPASSETTTHASVSATLYPLSYILLLNIRVSAIWYAYLSRTHVHKDGLYSTSAIISN